MTPLARKFAAHITEKLKAVDFDKMFEDALLGDLPSPQYFIDIITLIFCACEVSPDRYKLPQEIAGSLIGSLRTIQEEKSFEKLNKANILFVIVQCDAIVNHFSFMSGRAIPETSCAREESMFTNMYC